MHALFISYDLHGVTAAEHAELSAQLAPALAAVPGLVSLTWLSNEATGRYGGFFVFEHKPAFDVFIASELYEALRGRAAVRDLTAAEFSIERISTSLPREPIQAIREETSDAAARISLA